MTYDTKNILNDLYEIDPSLREHEAKLQPLISELLEARSDLAINPAFRDRLRTLLMNKIRDQKVAKPYFGRFFAAGLAGRSMYAMASALVLILVVAVSVTVVNRGGTQVAFEQDITKAKNEAFGPLAAAPVGGRGGGGGVETSGQKSSDTASATPSSGGGYGGGGNMTKPSSLIYPAPQPSYTFNYTGDPIELTEKSVEVLRRTKGLEIAPAFNAVIKSLDVSGLDLGSFGISKIQNLILTGDKNGYSITLDFFEGFIGISKTTPSWMNSCVAPDKCLNNQQPIINQKPDDAKLISAADRFLADHGIDRSTYGEPMIQDDWRMAYEQMPVDQRAQFYIPEAITVLYPLMLNGQTVYEQGGSFPMGIQVQVSIRDLTVESVWNMTIQKYESSKYDAETDPKKIISIAEQGGWGGYYIMDSGSQQPTQVSLGTPKRGYLRMWNYQNGVSDELYVPALSFPVVKPSRFGFYLPNYVTVPLAKDLILQNYPVPVPLEKMVQ